MNKKSQFCLREFEYLQRIIDDDLQHKYRLDQSNPNCRYRDIITYIDNKIILKSTRNYINASWIHIPFPNYFIATQGPLPHTIDDFWTMCYENDIEIIIMLCNLRENNVDKCADYWNAKNLKNFEIYKLNKNSENGLCVRNFQIYNKKTKVQKYIIHFQLLCWEDHSTLSKDYFNKIINLINNVDNYRNKKPAIIHCSAGIGRTGTFICMYNLYHEIMRQIYWYKDTKEIIFSIFNLVRKIKEMRIYSVENQYQYALLYDFVNYLLLKNNNKKETNI